MKQMEQQNVKYDPQIRKLQKERYADQGNDIAEEQLAKRRVFSYHNSCIERTANETGVNH